VAPKLLTLPGTDPVLLIWNCTEYVDPTLVGGNGIVPPGETGVPSRPALNVNEKLGATPLPASAIVRVMLPVTKVAVAWNAVALDGANPTLTS